MYNPQRSESNLLYSGCFPSVSLNASSRRWAWQCTLHTLHQGLVNLQCWSAFNFAMTPLFLPVITAAPSEPKPTIFFVQSCVSKPTRSIAVFSALQSWGDSSFNDSIPIPAHLSDSDSSHLGYDSDSDTIFMNDSDSSTAYIHSDSRITSILIYTPVQMLCIQYTMLSSENKHAFLSVHLQNCK